MIEKAICVGRNGRVVAVECQTILKGGSVGRYTKSSNVQL